MDLINSTRMAAGFTLGVEPSGREWLVVAIKGTFRLPTDHQEPLRLHEEQEPLCVSDVFWGAPGFSAPRYEADFPLRKPQCDVVLNASAYAPDGRPARRVSVAASIGRWSKSFTVIGDRSWEAGLTGIGPGPIRAFTQLPITYDRAFGGTDDNSDDPRDHAAFAANPSGRGFHRQLRREWVNGSPMPNTEEDGDPVTKPDGNYRPMSFGVIGRHWTPRVSFTGTYDQQWLDSVFPFLPSDFDERYYQSAPPDQQLAVGPGPQQVTLLNLTPDGRRSFVLPHLEAPVHVFPRDGGREDLVALIDTIVIEPDLERLMLVWRVARALKKNLFEIGDVLVGRKGPEWWQERERVVFPLDVVEPDDLTTPEDGA